MKKLSICVPVQSNVPIQFFYRFLKLISYLTQEQKLFFQPSFSNIMPLDAARNVLAQGALRNDSDYILWIDSDVLLTDTHFKELWAALHEKDGTPEQRTMVTGIYYEKEEPYEPVIRKWNNDGQYRRALVASKEPFKIAGAGLGAMLMRKEALKAVVDATDGKPFQFTKDFSEDLFFCEEAKKAGHTLWAVPAVQLSHMGSYVNQWHYLNYRAQVADNVAELSTYLKMDPAVCFDLCADAANTVARDWKLADPKTEEDRTNFYKNNRNYLYDLTWWWFHNKFVRDATLSQVSSDHKRVLDFGAGIGDYGLFVAHRYPQAKVDFYDINRPSLDYLEHRLLLRVNKKELTADQAKIFNEETFQWPKEEYDAIFAMDVFEHFAEPAEIIAKVRGMLKRNGIFLSYSPQVSEVQPQHLSNIDLTKYGFLQRDITTFVRTDSDFALERAKVLAK